MSEPLNLTELIDAKEADVLLSEIRDPRESHFSPARSLVLERYTDAVEAVLQADQIMWCRNHLERWHDVPAIMKGCYAGSELSPCLGSPMSVVVVPVETP